MIITLFYILHVLKTAEIPPSESLIRRGSKGILPLRDKQKPEMVVIINMIVNLIKPTIKDVVSVLHDSISVTQ